MTNFISFNSSFHDSEIVFLGIPFDGTVSFRPGSRFAPQSIRGVSEVLETYSPYQNRDLTELKVFDFGDLELPFGNTSRVLQIVEEKASEIITSNKKILTAGGEHLITYPLVVANLKKHPDLILLHFDAHADLRDSYLGESYSHSTVIRRISERLNPQNIYQFGIRSGEKEEFQWGKAHTNFFPFSLDNFSQIIDSISPETPLYVTLDLDILDPSYLPGTGTPEAGGVSFSELLNALLMLKNHNIAGADVVELAPDYDNSGISSITAAKLIREMALLMS